MRRHNLARELYSSSKCPFQPTFSSTGNSGKGTVSLGITLEWGPGGDPVDEPSSVPWWKFLLPSYARQYLSANPYYVKDQVSLSSLKLLQYVPSYPIAKTKKAHTNEWYSRQDDSSDEDHWKMLSAWHCSECGKLNVVAAFRYRSSWLCASCGVCPAVSSILEFLIIGCCR